MKKNELSTVEIETQIQPLATRAEELIITDQESMKEATTILSKLNKLNDTVEAEQDRLLTPLKEAMKIEKSRWAPAITYYKAGIAALRAKMTAYQTELINTTKAEEQRIASRIAPGKGNLSITTAVKKIEALPTVEKEVATDEGLVQFREKKQLKVTDISLIPDEYWSIREDDILTDLKKGVAVPGAEIETIQVPVNYR
jgi:hypothetical protein